MKTRSYSSILITALFALAIPLSSAAAQKHHHYKLIVLGTLGGPPSFADAGHNDSTSQRLTPALVVTLRQQLATHE